MQSLALISVMSSRDSWLPVSERFLFEVCASLPAGLDKRESCCWRNDSSTLICALQLVDGVSVGGRDN